MAASEESAAKSSIQSRSFGKLSDGSEVTLYTLSNSAGVVIELMSYGGTITSVRVPDRNGEVDDIVLGYDTLEDYEKKNTSYFGVTVGRFANRIGGAKFELEGKEYVLAKNNGDNTLHGGIKGFDKVNWDSKVDGDKVVLSYVSKDGEEGYPGTMHVSVEFSLNDESELLMSYTATTDAPTLVNLTNHSYFNLAGAGSGPILKHELQSPCAHFTPVNDGLIPDGRIEPVKGTPFDFRKSVEIGKHIGDVKGGYDHNLALKFGDSLDSEMAFIARLTDKESGRKLEVYTTEPAVQLYTGGFLDGSTGRGGKAYEKFGALCLETQHFPDAIHHPSFPNTVLRPSETFKSQTKYVFVVPRVKRKSSK